MCLLCGDRIDRGCTPGRVNRRMGEAAILRKRA